MVNLTETGTWVDGIYQIETVDRVQGGPDGTSNIQAKQLADRTAYLKKRIDEDIANATDPAKGAGMVGFQQSGAGAVARTMLDKAREVVSVKDFGAVGDGVTDDTAAIQAAIDASEAGIVIPKGDYYLASDIILNALTSVNILPNVTFTGSGRFTKTPHAFNAPTSYEEIYGRIVVRDDDSSVAHPDGFDTHAWMGQALRLDSKVVAGQCCVFISGDKRQPVIGTTHYVGLHTRHNNSAEAPNVWGLNPVVVKNVSTTSSPTGKASVLGMEISVSNNTTEPGTPLTSGECGGLFISYIHNQNRASHAMATGGYPGLVNGENGFENLLWLDGVVSHGTHINLRDEVSANSGARIGIDTSAVSRFTDGAIVLGNEHRIAGKTSNTAPLVGLIKVNSSNQVQLSENNVLTVVNGSLKVDGGGIEVGNSNSSVSFVDFHSSKNANDYDARIYASGGNATDGQGYLRVYSSLFSLGCNTGPSSDNSFNLGSSNARWANLYAATGTVNTSDEREKQDIAELEDAEVLVAKRLKTLVKKFRFRDAVEKKGDDARVHVGVIAQEVADAFSSEGLDANRYGILCYDEWDEQPEIVDEDGNVTQEYRPAGSRYGVRYEELLAFIIGAM